MKEIKTNFTGRRARPWRATWIGFWTVAAVLGCLASAYAATPVAGILAVTPLEGTVGTKIVLTGFGFGIEPGQVQLGSGACQVLAWGDTRIQCLVTQPLTAGVYAVIVSFPESEQRPPTSFNGFTMRAPQIAPETTPLLVTAGGTVTVAGTFFGDQPGSAWLEDEDGSGAMQPATVLAWSMNAITLEMPGGLVGTCLLGVMNGVGMDVEQSWCLFGSRPLGTEYIGEGYVVDNATAVCCGNHFWIFSPFQIYHDIQVEMDLPDTSQGFNWWPLVPGPDGKTKTQLAPLAVDGVLWLFHTAMDGRLLYKRHYRAWESDWHQITTASFKPSTPNTYEIAPVYNPVTHRLAVYYVNSENLSWVYSDDKGATWSAPQLVQGVVAAKGPPSAVYGPYTDPSTQQTYDTLVAFRITSPTNTSCVGLYHAANGSATGGCAWPMPNGGRPFVMDLSPAYDAVLWKSPTNGYPLISRMDKATGQWQAPYEAVDHETSFSPTGAVDVDGNFWVFRGDTTVLQRRWRMTAVAR
jgi:hypothetical protein